MNHKEFNTKERKFITTLYKRLKKNIKNPPNLGNYAWPEKMVDEFNLAMLTGCIARMIDEGRRKNED